MTRVVVLQSSYIPWKGYFDLIRAADLCVFYDEVQYTHRTWRNRNLIKAETGPAWLTIPIEVSGQFGQRIEDVRIARPDWWLRHWKTLVHAYSRARHFREYRGEVEALYAGLAGEASLARVNRRLTEALCALLGIRTPLVSSHDFPRTSSDPTERLVEICRQAGADRYLSGPAARAYLREEAFAEHGILLEYADYSRYAPYPQLHGEFAHGVSVLDLIFNTGAAAPGYLQDLA
jgi:hypothetical protein